MYKGLKSLVDRYDILSKSQYGIRENELIYTARPFDIVNKKQLNFDEKVILMRNIYRSSRSLS